MLVVADSAAECPGRTITVCLCDDVREFRELMREALDDDPGIAVVGEAADGVQAIDVVSDTKPDVVLLDLSMPGKDGLEVIDAVRDRSPDSRIVVLSGFAAVRMERVVLERGGFRYLEKGTPLSDIRAAIHEAAAA
jgi:YesN/AraC family two-component response regulator